MFSGTDCVVAGAYFARCSFCNLSDFSRFVSPYFDSLPCDVPRVAKKIWVVIRQLESFDGFVDQDVSLRLLIARDLRSIATAIATPRFQHDLCEAIPREDAFAETVRKSREFLDGIGIELPPTNIFLVDSVPSPYNKVDYKAVAIDEDDFEQHGINPGIYFVRRHLRPFASTALLLHELIHPIAASPNPYLLGRGLEEGFAEILGSMYLASKILGPELAISLFKYNRLMYGPNQFWDIYLDYTRQAFFLYRHFGLDGVAAIIRGGRDKIKEVEFKLSKGNHLMNIPAGHWDKDLDYVADALLLTYCRNLVVSPLAKYIMGSLKAGSNSNSLMNSLNINEHEGCKAIEELQSRVVLSIVGNNGNITLSDCVALNEVGAVRYEIPLCN
jgi:hypothetical protein